jgi:hypothetical protein
MPVADQSVAQVRVSNDATIVTVTLDRPFKDDLRVEKGDK